MKVNKKIVIASLAGLLIVVALLALVAGSLQPGQSQVATPQQAVGPITEQDKIWVISDLHYLSDKLHDEGEKFQFIKRTAAGKDLDFPKERMEALVWRVEQERPAVLVVSGDLTLNGEKQSALELAAYFQRIKDLGTAVYVIPGNHDISDGWARKYSGDEAERTAQILPQDFTEIFAEMGYRAAYARDEASLSYAVQPFKDLVFVMIDTNKYMPSASTSNPLTSGKLKDATSTWLADVFQRAAEDGLRVIPVMHHNLVDHNAFLNKGFTIDQAPNVQDFFFKYGISLVLTGHVHAQDISTVTRGEKKIYDCATGCFASLSNSLGVLSVAGTSVNYERQGLELSDWARASGQKDQRLLNYQDYSQGLFETGGQQMAYGQMFEEGWYDEATADTVAAFVGRMNVRYFDGLDYAEGPELLEQIKAEAGYRLLSQHPAGFLYQYIATLLVDDDVNDVQTTIPLLPLSLKEW